MIKLEDTNILHGRQCPWPGQSYRATLCVSAVFALARCLSVRPSVKLVLCIQTAEYIVQLLSFSGSPIILVFWPQAPIPNSQRNPFSGGAKYKWGGIFFAIFDWNRRLSWKRYEIGPWLPWNVNRKSYALYRMVTFSMTLIVRWPEFQGRDIFRHWISVTTRDRSSEFRHIWYLLER